MPDADVPAGLLPVAFRLGAWRGSGTLNGREVEIEAFGRLMLGSFVQVDLTTRAGGEFVHGERIVHHVEGGSLQAVTFDTQGHAQYWVLSADDELVTLVPDPRTAREDMAFAWTIQRQGPDRFRELFLAKPRDGAAGTIDVTYERVPEAGE